MNYGGYNSGGRKKKENVRFLEKENKTRCTFWRECQKTERKREVLLDENGPGLNIMRKVIQERRFKVQLILSQIYIQRIHSKDTCKGMGNVGAVGIKAEN